VSRNELLKQADEWLAKPSPISYSAHIQDSIVTYKLIQELSTKVREQEKALEICIDELSSQGQWAGTDKKPKGVGRFAALKIARAVLTKPIQDKEMT